MSVLRAGLMLLQAMPQATPAQGADEAHGRHVPDHGFEAGGVWLTPLPAPTPPGLLTQVELAAAAVKGNAPR